MKEKSHLWTQWASMWNRSLGTKRWVFAALELVFFPLSLLTFFLSLPLQIVANHMVVEIPIGYMIAFHILLSVAIGYITNYVIYRCCLATFVTTYSQSGCLSSSCCSRWRRRAGSPTDLAACKA